MAFLEHRTCSLCGSYSRHHKGRGKSTHSCAQQGAQEYDHIDKATPTGKANVRIGAECMRRSYRVNEAKTAYGALHICEAIEPLDYVSNHADNTFQNAKNHTGHKIAFSPSVFPLRLHNSFQGSRGSNNEGAEADGAEGCDEGCLQAAPDGGIAIFPEVPSSENAIASTSTCICYHHKAPHENKACYKIHYLVTCWCTVCCILHCSAMHSMETESAERTEQRPAD
mmetsp:Transcript_54546/g.100025  ORF Transcript_54546/g.100025 Transcript_54546/m.100025 type:complete len:225 (-) Transcript_54546:652-1326(-)